MTDVSEHDRAVIEALPRSNAFASDHVALSDITHAFGGSQ